MSDEKLPEFPLAIDEAALRERIDPLSYDVLRNAATERPFTGEYNDTDVEGSYRCKACGNELFRSENKFHSGWAGPLFMLPPKMMPSCSLK